MSDRVVFTHNYTVCDTSSDRGLNEILMSGLIPGSYLYIELWHNILKIVSQKKHKLQSSVFSPQWHKKGKYWSQFFRVMSMSRPCPLVWKPLTYKVQICIVAAVNFELSMLVRCKNFKHMPLMNLISGYNSQNKLIEKHNSNRSHLRIWSLESLISVDKVVESVRSFFFQEPTLWHPCRCSPISAGVFYILCPKRQQS